MEEAWKPSIFVRAGVGGGGCLVEGMEICSGRGQVGTREGGGGQYMEISKKHTEG